MSTHEEHPGAFYYFYFITNDETFSYDKNYCSISTFPDEDRNLPVITLGTYLHITKYMKTHSTYSYPKYGIM
jgi:hypothetical protein